MVRVLQKTLVAICLVLFFFVAAIILCQRAPWFPLENFGRQVAQSIPLLGQNAILGAAMFAIVVIGGLAVRSLREEVHITKQTEDGAVTIVESAIARYIRQVALDIESVQNVRTVITNTREGMVIDLYTKVLVTDSLPRIEKDIRTQMRAALEETLGLGGVASINVIVEGFEKVSPPAPSAAEEPPAPPPSEPPVVETPPPEGETAPSGTSEPVAATWSGFVPDSILQTEREQAQTEEAEEVKTTDELEESEQKEAAGEDVEGEPGEETPESDTSEEHN